MAYVSHLERFAPVHDLSSFFIFHRCILTHSGLVNKYVFIVTDQRTIFLHFLGVALNMLASILSIPSSSRSSITCTRLQDFVGCLINEVHGFVNISLVYSFNTKSFNKPCIWDQLTTPHVMWCSIYIIEFHMTFQKWRFLLYASFNYLIQTAAPTMSTCIHFRHRSISFLWKQSTAHHILFISSTRPIISPIYFIFILFCSKSIMALNYMQIDMVIHCFHPVLLSRTYLHNSDRTCLRETFPYTIHPHYLIHQLVPHYTVLSYVQVAPFHLHLWYEQSHV